MFLPLLFVAATLIGSWMFLIIFPGVINSTKPVEHSILITKRVSLVSLILFLLFGKVNAPSKSKQEANDYFQGKWGIRETKYLTESFKLTNELKVEETLVQSCELWQNKYLNNQIELRTHRFIYEISQFQLRLQIISQIQKNNYWL